MDMDSLLQALIESKGSDLHITVGRPPVIRLHGGLVDLPYPPLTPEDTEGLLRSVTPERHYQEFQEAGSTDYAFAFHDGNRFRVSAFRQRGLSQMALRIVPSKLLSFDDIGLPQQVRSLLDKTRGLVLVTGPTGSGKTTTLSTMIDYINNTYDRHIVTVEDPIEYYHTHKKSVVTQREVGEDVPTFSEALRRALRQDPDVILLGEMRDLETIHAAVSAAETGHLVFGTLHTTGATRTVDRIIDAFPADQQAQIRAQLAVSVIAVISQVLLPRVDQPGRVAGFEVMFMTAAIENHIRKNETFKIHSVIQTSKKQGMVLLDDQLFDHFQAGRISVQEMMSKAQNHKDLEERLAELGTGGAKKKGW
jgi:twitching motility protein PilT